MTFLQWYLWGDMINVPQRPGQWGVLHISVMLLCVASIVGFYFIVKYSKNKERAINIILYSLIGISLFFEVTQRIAYALKMYVYHHSDVAGCNIWWLLLPKPWCQISTWMLIMAVLTKKKFLYNYASISALLCSLIFFAYPGVGFNSENCVMYFDLYSISTHAILLTASITLITLKRTDFRYKGIWKVAICFALTVIYVLIQVYVLKIAQDPLYFMPGGDIQAGILGIPYGLYLFLYIALILIFFNAFYLINDRKNVKNAFGKLFKKNKTASE